CFFTGLGLNVKNLITGASGGAIARQEVMKAYREFCENEVSSYEGKNKEIAMAECYNKYKSNINQDIEAYKRAIQDVQNEIKGLSLDEWKKRNVNKQFTIGDTKINANDFSSWAEVKNYLIYEAYIKNGGNLDSVTGQNLKLNHESDLEKLRRNSEERQKEEEARQKIKQIFGVEGITPIVLGEDRVKTFARTGIQQMMVPNLPSELNNMQYEAIVFNGVEYLVGLTYISPTRYQINSEAVLKKDGSGNWEKVDLTKEKNKQLREELSRITIIDGEKCEFPYKEMPVVRYYNQRIAKGLPAIVPFDNESGWYVKVSAAQGSLVSKEVKGYYDSGDVNFFFVCNVGPNGKEEDKGGDDICQSFDINNYDKVERFNGCSGLTQTEIKQLGDDARQAIRQVASQYNDVISKKLSSIYIKVGSRRGFNAKVGLDYDSESPIAECYDFMSVDDCNILFNVCDPIICPASRCDFGGKMPVDNVIASGIAGSLFLCLPNFGSPTKGKVLVPICLTGVHAGLDAYLSILRAQYQCMDEAMKTGKYVGVCDYITAIYKCEFFWRNAQPMLKNFVPMALEFLNDPTSLGRSKGGGEYLTFQRAWDNMEQSLDFFKNKYSGTSFRNLQFSNTQEIGSEICRRFIGTSMPTKANFKEVFAPDSPTQFYAEFSEIPFTEATSPPTSQYKVLYHIYAGNDQSVSYRVYLKDPPASPQYQGHATIYVASGIIGKGKFASESKDFTGPQGYKQLCVELNGVEKCGFKQVTSDVGIEYLKKIQVKKEAERTDIVTEKECVYGGSSILGLTSSLNVEEDAQASLTPEISKRGLIRICASEDPGKSVEPGRWVQVGYCGNPNIKCWLDTKSINQETVGLVQAAGTIKKAESILKQEEEGELNLRQNEANVNARLNEIAANISKLTNVDGEISQIEKSLNEIRNALDYQMARVSYLRAKLYEQAVIILTNMKKLELAVEVSPKTPATTNGATVSKTEENDDSNKNLASLNLNNEIIYRGKKYVVYQKNDEAIGFVLLKADGERDPSNIKKCSLAQKKTVKDCFG
ncbi:MAG: hypothetical protein QXX68_02250, partial [Candidatus Pacearchaeota archaeon]